MSSFLSVGDEDIFHFLNFEKKTKVEIKRLCVSEFRTASPLIENR